MLSIPAELEKMALQLLFWVIFSHCNNILYVSRTVFRVKDILRKKYCWPLWTVFPLKRSHYSRIPATRSSTNVFHLNSPNIQVNNSGDCKGTLLFSLLSFIPWTLTYISFVPLCSFSLPFLSTSFPPTPFASEPRPVTPESSRASDSPRTRFGHLGLARTLRTRSDS